MNKFDNSMTENLDMSKAYAKLAADTYIKNENYPTLLNNRQIFVIRQMPLLSESEEFLNILKSWNISEFAITDKSTGLMRFMHKCKKAGYNVKLLEMLDCSYMQLRNNVHETVTYATEAVIFSLN